MSFRSHVITREQDLASVLTLENLRHKLIVWNDEVNTFDWVIQSLVEICDHVPEQAEQCAMMIHNKGRYAVKHGDRTELRVMREALSDRGIGATVEA
ncbi:MAG: ATP-dependent Clp protease adaptor ClpS [Bacteroidia bacterium]